MDNNNCSNILGEVMCKSFEENYSFLDKNNIIWKMVNGEWIGKRSVWTKDRRGCWLEDTTIDNVKSWWCGEDSDYIEIFKRDNE
jgi:hypothetical protein